MHKTPNASANTLTSTLVRPMAAGLAITSAGAVSAAVIHNDTPLFGSQSFAVDPGDDFTFNVNPGTMPFNDPNLKIFDPGTPSSVWISPLAGAMISTGQLAFGTEVGTETAFSNTAAYDMVGGTFYYGFSLPGTTTLYGWISVTHNPGMGFGSGSVNEWAYETTGAPILVGQTTAVPEPASSVAAAALIAGSAAMLRRRGRKLESLAAAA